MRVLPPLKLPRAASASAPGSSGRSRLRSARPTPAPATLSLAWPSDGQTEAFEGRIEGTLVWPPRGDKGFGYDPIFVPAGRDQTFGEMEPELKHRISHRADAFRKLVMALKR